MRRGLAGHVQPFFFRLTDQLHALSRRYVADMVGASRFANQCKIPLHLPPFGLGADALVPVRPTIGTVMNVATVQKAVILAMRHDNLAQALRFHHGSLHHLVPLYAASVIRKRHHMRCQGHHIRKPLASLPCRNGSVRKDADCGIPPDNGKLFPQMFNRVGCGIQIRHSAHCRKPAVRRRAAAVVNGLFIRKTRLAEMHMHIRKTG